MDWAPWGADRTDKVLSDRPVEPYWGSLGVCFRIHLRIRGCLLKIHNHRVCTAPPSSAFDTESHRSRCTAGASGSARRLLPPESVSIGSLSAGAASAQHTHTQSPFATPSPPMGVRGRGLWRKWHWVICKWHIFPVQCRRHKDWSKSDLTERLIHPDAGWLLDTGG